jgi:hypothetical protein
MDGVIVMSFSPTIRSRGGRLGFPAWIPVPIPTRALVVDPARRRSTVAILVRALLVLGGVHHALGHLKPPLPKAGTRRMNGLLLPRKPCFVRVRSGPVRDSGRFLFAATRPFSDLPGGAKPAPAPRGETKGSCVIVHPFSPRSPFLRPFSDEIRTNQNDENSMCRAGGGSTLISLPATARTALAKGWIG